MVRSWYTKRSFDRSFVHLLLLLFFISNFSFSHINSAIANNSWFELNIVGSGYRNNGTFIYNVRLYIINNSFLLKLKIAMMLIIKRIFVFLYAKLFIRVWTMQWLICRCWFQRDKWIWSLRTWRAEKSKKKKNSLVNKIYWLQKRWIVNLSHLITEIINFSSQFPFWSYSVRNWNFFSSHVIKHFQLTVNINKIVVFVVAHY